MSLSSQIIDWYNLNKRDLPWRKTRNPYKIWLSEIILQQTQIKQGTPYYNRFVQEFPTISSLANSKEEKVLKMWQGLGYYSRARNLHFAANQIVKKFDGVFPKNYDELMKLKGIGEYTAAAVASFAFNLPHAVVDGNVFRFLARYFEIYTPINSNVGKKEFFKLANKIIDQKKPGEHNQAIMDFGSQQCRPINPNCNICLLKNNCIGFQKNIVSNLPIKIKQKKKKKVYFDYFVILNKQYIYIKKRKENGIWRNLYDFPLKENLKKTTDHEIQKYLHELFDNNFKIEKISKTYEHVLTHKIIIAKFWTIRINQSKYNGETKRILLKNINQYPVPRLIELFLQEEKLIN